MTATLDEAARPEATEFTVEVADGTAVAGTDFAAVPDFALEIPAGRTSGSATFRLTTSAFDNDVSAPNKTLQVTASTVSGLAVDPVGGLTVTIADDEDAPVAKLVLTPASIREDGGVSRVTATLDRPSSADTTVTVSAVPVDPAVDGDFELSFNRTLTIAAGETESAAADTVTITAVDNDVAAPVKRVTVSGVATNSQRVVDPGDVTLTVTDNDQASTTATLSVSPADVQEGGTETITVTAELDGAARTVDTVITVSVGTGTASASDFTPVENVTLTIPAGQKSGTADFTLATVDDETDEPDETVRVTGRTTGLRMAPSGGVTVTIGNDDPDPRVTLVLTPDSISENGGSSRVKAMLSHPSSAATTVEVSAAPGGDAVAGNFRRSGSRLTIPAGATESTGTVTISGVDNNAFDAAPRSVTVSGAASNAEGVEQPAAQTLTIEDDDRPSTMVTLTVSPDRVAEDGGARRLTVTGTLNGAPETADTEVTLTVDAGAAAEAVEAVLTIPEGRRSATAALALTPDDNDIDEPDREVAVNAAITSQSSDSQLTGLNPSSLTVTVTDDDERGVTVSMSALEIREGPDGGASYTVVLGSAPTSTVTVTPSTQSQPADANVTVQPSSLDFTASDWNEPQMVTVTAVDDPDVEEDAVFDIEHTVSGGDYETANVTAAPVTVTVLGFEEEDGSVMLRTPTSGETVVTVPEGTSVPAGTQVTLPSSASGENLTIQMIAPDHEALLDPPQGFRADGPVVDIEPEVPLVPGETAVVCLPGSGGDRVHRWDDSLDPPEWVELDPPPGGSPPGLACGVTDHFSLFALGSAPGEMAVQSWLSRFGRTVAQQIVVWVEDRLSAPREAGLRGKVAGRGLGGPAARPDPNLGHAGDGGAAAFGREGRARGMSGRELLTGTSFTLTGEETGAGSLAVWGRAAHSRFDGRESGASLDGEVTTMALGMDRATGPWTWGVSLARSEGRGTHRLDERSNRLSSSLTGLYPYVGYKSGNGVLLWGVAGYGEGDLELTLEGGDPQEARLTLAMAATGARGELLSGGDGFSLAVETDALFVRTSSGEAADLAATDADASRLRVGLEGSWTLATEEGARLRPALKAGLRHDGGDAETGLGIDLGGSLSWSDPALGFTTDLSAHGLLAHEAGGFAERGISGSLSWDRDPSSDRGLAVTVRQSLGSGASGGTDRLLERQTMAGLDRRAGGGSGGRFDAELGYGLPVLGNRFTGTPWVGFGLSGSDRDYTLGWRFRPLGGAGLNLGLEATRRESANDNRPEHAAVLRLRARW